MKVFSVGSAPMESSVSIILNTPQSRVPEVCDITASTSYRTNRLTVTKIVTGLFIRFAPFCSFRQQKAKTPQNRDSEAKKAKKMVHPTRFELMTFYSGGRRSIQLSYGCPCHCYIKYSLFSIFKAPLCKKPDFFLIFPLQARPGQAMPHLPQRKNFSSECRKPRITALLPLRRRILPDPDRFRRRIDKDQLFPRSKYYGN